MNDQTMNAIVPSIEPVGDRCLMIRCADQLSAEVSQFIQALAASLLTQPIAGVIDIVPAFASIALHYRPAAFTAHGASPFATLRALLEQRLAAGLTLGEMNGRIVEVPTCYGGEFGPDLEEVAQRCGLSSAEVIRLHGAEPLPILAFFFTPGNPFSGQLDARLQIPRRSSPRTQVPAGSVAIANRLTAIYPTASPGGWHLIGRTPWTLFDVTKQPPTRFNIGDRLRFVPIGVDEFHALDERAGAHA